MNMISLFLIIFCSVFGIGIFIILILMTKDGYSSKKIPYPQKYLNNNKK